MDVAGITSPNAAPWARPYSSQREMSVTYMRVRTTSASPTPRPSRACATFAIACVVCAPASPGCTNTPSATDVQPETNTKSPAATARLYPTTGSHGVLVDTFRVTLRPPAPLLG